MQEFSDIVFGILAPLVLFGVGLILGFLYRSYTLYKEILAAQHELVTSMEENVAFDIMPRVVHKLTHEVHDSVNYFYIHANSEFAAQGATLQEAAVHFTSRYGRDAIGWYKIPERQIYQCFVNNKCIEVIQ